MYGQIGTYWKDYIHLSDAELKDHAETQWGNRPMDPTLRAQAVKDVLKVIEDRAKGEHWAWKWTALLSAFDKTKLADFATQLSERGWRIMGSRGTAKFLNDQGIKAWDIATIVGEPILGHRVVTLSREIHAALLARRDNQEDKAELEKLKVPFIDLVYVNMYPLVDEISKPDATLSSVIDSTDIGGPTMLRSAAKGRRLAVCRPSEFPLILKLISGHFYRAIEKKYPHERQLEKAQAEARVLDDKITSGLAAIAEEEIAKYCQASSGYHAEVAGPEFIEMLKAA